MAGGHEAERGADLFAGEGAQTGATEIAIVARRFCLFAHWAFLVGVEQRGTRSDHRAVRRRVKALPETKTNEFPADSNPPKRAVSSPFAAGLPARATPVENCSQG